MSLKVNFGVHGVSDTTVGLLADVDGEKMGVTTKCLEVELTSKDGRHGSLTLRFVKDAEAAYEIFNGADTVTATFERTSGVVETKKPVVAGPVTKEPAKV